MDVLVPSIIIFSSISLIVAVFGVERMNSSQKTMNMYNTPDCKAGQLGLIQKLPILCS